MESALLDRPVAGPDLDPEILQLPSAAPVEFEFRGWEDDAWISVGEPGLFECIAAIREGGPEVGFVRRRGEDIDFAQVALDSRRGLAVEFRPAVAEGRYRRAWVPGLPETRVNIRVGSRGYLWWSPRCELVSLHVAVAAIVLMGRERRLLDGLALREPTTGQTEYFAGIRRYWF